MGNHHVTIRSLAGACRHPWFLAGLFCLYAAVAIPMIALLMPPLQAADETAHAQRANEISHGGLIATRFNGPLTSGGVIDLGLIRLWRVVEDLPFRPDHKLTQAMERQAAAVTWKPRGNDSFANTAIYPPLLYAPAAIGQAAGRWLHLSVLHAMLLSRLLDGAASTVLAAIAIGLGDALAPLLFTLLCLPMSLALFAAITQDGPMIALSALAVSLFARARRGSAYVAAGSTALGLAAMARPPMLPFCLLPWLLPGLSRRARMTSTALPIAAALGWTVMTDRITLYRPSADQVAAQTHAILAHPQLLATLVWTTIQGQWLRHCDIFQGFVGVLGWLDTPLPASYYALTAVVMILAIMVSVRDQPPLDTTLRRLAAAALFLGAVCAVFLLEYLSWSPVGSRFIEGVQGRYFLPIMPFLGFLLPRHRLPDPVWARLALCLYPALSITITVQAIVLRYYLS